MKRSDRWFNERAVQDTRLRVSTLPVLARVGPDNPVEPHRDKNSKGNSYFKVGKTEVGGEEVVG
jgi:hypothetical protein